MQTVPSLNICYTDEKVRRSPQRNTQSLVPCICSVTCHCTWPCALQSMLVETAAQNDGSRTVDGLASTALGVAQGYVTADVAEKEGLHRLNLSGTKFRQLLRCGSSHKPEQLVAHLRPHDGTGNTNHWRVSFHSAACCAASLCNSDELGVVPSLGYGFGLILLYLHCRGGEEIPDW